ncbi:MAG: ROK family protein, partial [Planctomycetaceae bacterium]|nr:ROK family protein [Planctomycetaceae bacterium]
QYIASSMAEKWQTVNSTSRKGMKTDNRNHVLDIVRNYGAVDIARLAEVSGLSKLTVSKIIAHWRDMGVVIPKGKGIASGEAAGKKPPLYAINSEYRLVFVSQLYETSLFSAVANLDANIIMSERVEFPKDTPLETILDFARKAFDEMSAKLKLTDSRFASVVLGTSGITDANAGVIVYSPHFPSWGYNVPVAGMLRHIFPRGFTLHVDNWVRYQAYAESKIGQARQVRRFLEIGTEPDGVTSGLVWDGSLVSGKCGLAGEIGHMPVDMDSDVVCACGGRGCLEPAISLLRMQARARERAVDWPDSVLVRDRDPADISYRDVFPAADLGDAFARDLLDRPAKFFAAAITNVMQVCDPELIIIQGEYAKAGTYFLDLLKDRVRKVTLPGMDKNIRIQYSTLSDKQGLIGAAHFAADQFYATLE